MSMHNLDTPLASFSALIKPKSKARPAFPLSPSTHPHLTPKALAEAGFFFAPQDSADDTCQCFLCGLKLGGWDEGDDPFEEHSMRGKCGWAETVCRFRVERRKGETSRVYADATLLPSSAENTARRKDTFGKWWPHKPKKGWIPNIDNLALAGFVFAPDGVSEDLTKCVYCDYAVEGWEATDDPWEIHSKKSPECRFFTATVEGRQEKEEAHASTSSQQPTKTGRGTRSQASRKSKRAPTAPPSEAGTNVETVADLDIPESIAEEASALSQSTAATRKGRQPRATTATRPRAGRGKKVPPVKEPDGPDEQGGDSGMESDNGAAITAKPTSQVEEVEAESHLKPKRRGRPKKSEASKGRTKNAGVELDAEIGETVVREEGDAIARRPITAAAPRPLFKASASTPESVVPPPILSSQSEMASLPRSQLEAFGNVPPTSPISPVVGLPMQSFVASRSGPPSRSAQPQLGQPSSQAPSQRSHPAAQADHSFRSDRPRPSPSSRASGRIELPSEMFDQSVRAGAVEARRVMQDLIDSPVLNRDLTPRSKTGEIETMKLALTEEQKGLTLEALVRSEMTRRFEALKAEGEGMIGKWEERAKEARRRIEAL